MYGGSKFYGAGCVGGSKMHTAGRVGGGSKSHARSHVRGGQNRMVQVV